MHYLKKYLDNAELGMTADSYFEMCETMGYEIIDEEIPPRFSDFPLYVSQGMRIFNALGDTYCSTMEKLIFMGKDYSSLKTLLDIYQVPDDETLLVLDVIQFLDSRARTKAAKEASKKPK